MCYYITMGKAKQKSKNQFQLEKLEEDYQQLLRIKGELSKISEDLENLYVSRSAENLLKNIK